MKDGHLRTYAGLRVTLWGKPASFSFPIAEETDRAGNAVRYRYSVPHGASGQDFTGEYFPERIDSTYQAQRPEEPARRSVRFVYEDRPDIAAGAIGGAAGVPFIKVTKRLRRIELHAPSAVEPQLANGDGKEELLLSVGPSLFLRATSDPAHPLAESRLVSRPIDDVDFEKAQIADLNGDGRPEIVAPNEATHRFEVFSLATSPTDAVPSFTSTPLPNEPYDPDFPSPLFLVDLDGDGLPDRVGGDFTAKGWRWTYRQNLGQGLTLGPELLNDARFDLRGRGFLGVPVHAPTRRGVVDFRVFRWGVPMGRGDSEARRCNPHA
jgi:hypothetical protein